MPSLYSCQAMPRSLVHALRASDVPLDSLRGLCLLQLQDEEQFRKAGAVHMELSITRAR